MGKRLHPVLHRVLTSKYFPCRKTIASGLSGVLAFFLTRLFHVSPDMAVAIVSMVTTIISYIVPPSVNDLVKTADTVITDVSGKVTDVLWKFDKVKKEKRKVISNASTTAAKTERPDKQDKPDSPPVSRGSYCLNGSCGCHGAQGDQGVRNEASDPATKTDN